MEIVAKLFGDSRLAFYFGQTWRKLRMDILIAGEDWQD